MSHRRLQCARSFGFKPSYAVDKACDSKEERSQNSKTSENIREGPTKNCSKDSEIVKVEEPMQENVGVRAIPQIDYSQREAC